MIFKKPNKRIPRHDSRADAGAERKDPSPSLSFPASTARQRLAESPGSRPFPHPPSLAISLLLGTAFASLTYATTESTTGALLTGITLALASIAINEASYLRRQTEALFAFLDASSPPADSKQARQTRKNITTPKP